MDPRTEATIRLYASPSNPAPRTSDWLDCHRPVRDPEQAWARIPSGPASSPTAAWLTARLGALLVSAGARLTMTGTALRDADRAA